MLRRATVADADALGAVQLRSWLHAYAGIVEPELLARQTLDERRERWRAILGPELQSAGSGRPIVTGSETWVACVGDRVAGFAAVGAPRRPPGQLAALTPAERASAQPVGARGGIAELYAIYVDPPAQGAGLGTRLLGHAVDRLRERGFGAAVLWTFVENGLARAFYERHGWRPEPGSEAEADPSWWAPSIRYGLEL